MLGSTLSMLIGYYLAGWLNELYGWHTMFKLLAVPGVVLAALAWILCGNRAGSIVSPM